MTCTAKRAIAAYEELGDLTHMEAARECVRHSSEPLRHCHLLHFLVFMRGATHGEGVTAIANAVRNGWIRETAAGYVLTERMAVIMAPQHDDNRLVRLFIVACSIIGALALLATAVLC